MMTTKYKKVHVQNKLARQGVCQLLQVLCATLHDGDANLNRVHVQKTDHVLSV